VRPCVGWSKKGIKPALYDISRIYKYQKMAILRGARSPLGKKNGSSWQKMTYKIKACHGFSFFFLYYL